MASVAHLLKTLGWRLRVPEPPAPGLYHYDRAGTGGQRVRLHLRLDPDGRGLLTVNAAQMVHLNPTAAQYAYLILEGAGEADAVHWMRGCYRVSREAARADFRQVAGQIEGLSREDGTCPVCELGFESAEPFSQQLSAPYRMDLALTYRCDNRCAHCYVARPPDFPELPTGEWKRIIERVWQVGIPHVCFTGGEATMRADLPELVAHAEAQGQIAGLLTNGRRLSDAGFVQDLKQAGLDHVQITLESCDEGVHDAMVGAAGAWRETVAGIDNALAAGLYMMTNTTLTQANVHTILPTLDFLAGHSVPTVACNGLIYSGKGASVGTGLRERDLVPVLEAVRERAEARDLRLIWYTPTQYCRFNPLQLELGVKGCSAARYNMCVEPDGSVIPCQSYYRPLGHVLRDPWEAIWNHELALHIRERRYVEERCRTCPELQLCGGGCPLSRENIP